MKYVFAMLLVLIFNDMINAQNDYSTKAIQKLENYINNGGDLNEKDKYGDRYYQHFIWSYGFNCNKSQIHIVQFLISQDQKLQDPFWFMEDPCTRMSEYIFNYVSLLVEADYKIDIKVLKDIVYAYYLSFKSEDYNPINTIDDYDKTPLMYACEMNNKKLVKYLLAEGADPFYENRHGENAFDYCNNKRISRLLK